MIKLTFPLPFADALEQVAARGVVLPDVYYSPAYTALMRAESFSVAGLASIEQIQRVKDTVAKLLQNGGTFADFKRKAGAMDWGLPPHRLELILRNGLQNAYQAGHWRAFDENKKAHPYLRYSAINDSRVRPSHLALNGVVRPVDDPFWETHSPPLGHRCRCSLRSLSPEEAEALGGPTPKEKIPAEAQPDPGWGYHPLRGREQFVKDQTTRLATQETALGHDAPQYKALRDQLKSDDQRVVDFGLKNKREVVLARDLNTGEEVINKAGTRSAVDVSAFTKVLNDPKRALRITHNHPSSHSLSGADLSMATSRGVASIRAVGHNGAVYDAAALASRTVLEAAHKAAAKEVQVEFQVAVNLGDLPASVAQALHWHVVNTSLDWAGVVAYTAQLGEVAESYMVQYAGTIRRTLEAAAKAAYKSTKGSPRTGSAIKEIAK